MDTALPQKFPFILDRNLAKANCTEIRVWTSCDIVVIGCDIFIFFVRMRRLFLTSDTIYISSFSCLFYSNFCVKKSSEVNNNQCIRTKYANVTALLITRAYCCDIVMVIAVTLLNILFECVEFS